MTDYAKPDVLVDTFPGGATAWKAEQLSERAARFTLQIGDLTLVRQGFLTDGVDPVQKAGQGRAVARRASASATSSSNRCLLISSTPPLFSAVPRRGAVGAIWSVGV